MWLLLETPALLEGEIRAKNMRPFQIERETSGKERELKMRKYLLSLSMGKGYSPWKDCKTL